MTLTVYLLIAVVVVEAVVNAVETSLHHRTIRALARQYAHEREVLISQLGNFVGKPWLPPPAETFAPEPDEFALVRSPEQLPDDWTDE